MKNIKYGILIAILSLTIIFCLLLMEALDEERMLSQYNITLFQESVEEMQDSLFAIEHSLSSSAISIAEKQYYYGEFNAEDQTIQLTLSFVPTVEKGPEIQGILHCNGKNIPLTITEEGYCVTYDVPIFETQKISAITWIDGEIAQTDFFTWTINPADQIVPIFYSYTLGSASGDAEKGRSYSFTIYFHLLNLPEQFGSIREINLVEVLDGMIYKTTSIHYSFGNLMNVGNLSIKKKVCKEVGPNETLELIIEIVDENDLHYHFLVQRVVPGEMVDWYFSGEVSVFQEKGNVLYTLH